jgi:excisionase family DNA binding protein
VLSLSEAAKYLGYSESGLRKIVKRKEIRFAQSGQGPIKFQREWLDEFLVGRGVERSPAQSRRAPISIQPEHGFDPSLLQADTHSGSE